MSAWNQHSAPIKEIDVLWITANGSRETQRPYSALFKTKRVDGVIDIHTDFVEPPELVRDRILYAVETFGGPERIQVTPDCGLRTRSWESRRSTNCRRCSRARPPAHISP